MHFYPLLATKRAFVFSLALSFSTVAGAAGLLEVKQTVFGMDCAPCAHGLEKGLEKMEGVEDVSVSLNEGFALASLRPNNSVAVEKIRQVVRNNGFTPKEAMVVVSGVLTRTSDDSFALRTRAGRRYVLNSTGRNASAWDRVKTVPAGATVTVNGIFGANESDRLSVLAVEPAEQ